MLRLCQVLVCVSLLALTLAPAAAQPVSPPASSDEVMVSFHDGSVVRKVALAGSIDVQTKYGKLTIPVRDIQRIDLAFRLSPEDARQVEEAVRQLGNQQFKQRESAARRLIELGPKAYPALLRATESKDMETARRAQGLVQHIQQTVPADRLQAPPNDVIRTGDSVLTGRVVGDALKARTRAFGEVQLKLTDLRSIQGEATPTVTSPPSGSSAPVGSAPSIPPAPPADAQAPLAPVTR